MRARALILAAVLAAVLGAMPGANAIHFYRGDCDDNGTNDGRSGNLGSAAAPASTVMLLHNTFNDAANGLPVTRIQTGEAVRWTWNSAHCHSVQSDGNWNSGFFYPTATPDSPQAVPGFFEYPVPETEAGLSYTRVFPAAGTFLYYCIHHQNIGMRGVVIVEDEGY